MATLVSFGVGYAVIVGFLRYLSRGTFTPFVVYRLLLAAPLVGLLGVGVLEATSPTG